MLAALASLASLTLAAPSPVYADGRDDRTLLPQKLVNRNLPAQVALPRLGVGLGRFTAAADVQIGTQVPLDGEGPTPFHGFFVSDAYLSFRILEGLDVNLNVLMLNTTASGGFRVQSDVLPGLNAHLTLELGVHEGDPVILDFVTPDLDVVTLGEGLLVETIPLEGFRGGLSWRGWEMQVVFGGRVFWQQDDLLHFSLTALDGRVGGSFTQWFSGFFTEEDGEVMAPANGSYGALFGRWSPWPGLTFAGELGARFGGPKAISTAALGRADLVHQVADFAVHLGYQMRWYQTSFGPLDALSTPSTLPSVPQREDYYFTNSFEYLWLSPFFDQWSHTAMIEAIYRVEPIEIFVELEWWLRFAADSTAATPRLIDTRVGALPGQNSQAFYRFGARVYPFETLPHRMSAFVSNKSVFSFGNATVPTPIRFFDRPIVFVEAEVFL